MHTLDDVKQELVDHLYSLDKSKMSISDLRNYAETVQVVCNIMKADREDLWLQAIKAMGSSCSYYKTADMKEGE